MKRSMTLSRNSLPSSFQRKCRKILTSWQLYVLILPALIYLFIFCYKPMSGVIIAFKDFKPGLGIMDSKWVGFKHFTRFLNLPAFWDILTNTLGISIYSLLATFPLPVILALSMNCIECKWFKKTIQTVTYAPHFISTVVIVGMVEILFHPNTGIVNHLVQLFGADPIFFMGKPEYFKHMYVWSGVWQGMGWSSIIYLAALSGVDPSLHEAAEVDGASRWQRVWNIDLPTIIPTIVIMLILNCGKIMNVGFEKAYLMQNPLNLEAAEIISTYVYKIGIIDAQFSFSTAVGLFNSIINIILLLTVNKISSKLTETSLW